MRGRDRKTTKHLIEDDGDDQPQERCTNVDQAEEASTGLSDITQNSHPNIANNNDLIFEIPKALEKLQKQRLTI